MRSLTSHVCEASHVHSGDFSFGNRARPYSATGNQVQIPQHHPANQIAQTRPLGNQTVQELLRSKQLYTKLTLGQPNDEYEQEADRVAEQVAREPSKPHLNDSAESDLWIQRKCADCSSSKSLCKECAEEEGMIQRKTSFPQLSLQGRQGRSASHAEDYCPDTRNASLRMETDVDELTASGQPLPEPVRTFFEPRFGRDFGDILIHTDARAAEAARALHSLAFTIGRDVFFDSGSYAPETTKGRRLLAHELTHAVQQARYGGGRQIVARQPRGREGEEAGPTTGPRATDFRRIGMHFDGADLVVRGDGTEVFRFSAQSGRPIPLTSADAAACGADVRTDSYMNDKRFVGIRDAGPIPEGTYRFRASAIQRFTRGEQLRLVLGGIFGEERVEAAGESIHPGDWGSGRVALTPVGRLREGPCGRVNDPHGRHGFFLHGGILAGSSGCIDIGGDFDTLASFMSGFTRPVTLTVQYTQPPPSVRYFTGLSAAVAYGGFDIQHGPRAALGAEFGPTGPRALGSFGYDLVAAWAGGAASLGLRLDVPMTDRQAFVRAGLEGGTNFRILGALYGRMFGGVMVPLSGEAGGPSLEVGGGLGYDFGRVQLEALYDVLNPMAQDERVHQVLLGIGFRFGRQ